mgnify:CR=1 FL=1
MIYNNIQGTERRLLKKAFRIIKRNYGCPGNDNVSISEVKINYKEYEDTIYQKLKKDSFVFDSNPKSVIIQDYLGKKREIFVYNVDERWVQEFLKLQIEPTLDTTLEEYVYAFRRGKNDKDSYKYILKNNPKFILRIDIKDYFNSIDKERLFTDLKNLNLGDTLFKNIKKSLEHCTKGLPAGHVLSCMLSNFNLKDFDSKFSKNYTRYSDDIMFGVETMDEARKILRTAKKLLEEYGFSLNPAKTRIITNPTLGKIS